MRLGARVDPQCAVRTATARTTERDRGRRLADGRRRFRAEMQACEPEGIARRALR